MAVGNECVQYAYKHNNQSWVSIDLVWENAVAVENECVKYTSEYNNQPRVSIDTPNQQKRTSHFQIDVLLWIIANARVLGMMTV